MTRFQAHPKNFDHRLIVEDEIWVHNLEPESKIETVETD